MSFVRYAAAALLPAAALGSGIIIADDNRMVQQDGLVRYPIVPQEGGLLFGKHSNITKRQIATDSFIQRSGTLYTIELNIGTPGQIVPVQFDTGSSELWVNPVCSESTTPEWCSKQGRFTESTSLQDVGAEGMVKYGTGYAKFNYVVDYVAIGSARITQQMFGVAFESAHAVVGIMGAGPALEGWENDYDLPIDSLAKQGLTNSRAFSLDLRGFDSARGSVIFGGLDVKKYTGSLVKRPIIPRAQSPDGLTRFWVYLNGISVNQPDGTVVPVYTTSAGGKGQPVLLDSGYTLSALPTAIFTKLLAAFPSAQHVPDTELYQVDCADPGKGGSLDFTFGDKVINVPYYDFVWHYPETDLCVLGAFEDSFPVLGDTFLRSAYAVYDWDNREIWLGQSADCGSELVTIGKGPNAVPIIAGKCGQPDTTTTTTSTSTSTSSTSSSSSSSSTSTTVSTTSTTSTTSTSASSTSASSTSTVSSTSWTTDASSTTTSITSSTSVSSSSSTTSATSSTSGSSSSTSSTSSASSTSSSSSSSAQQPSSTTDTSSDSGGSSTTTTPASSTTSTVTRSTITQTTTRTYTITSCAPTVTHCPLNHVTTEVITKTTAICPETTGTYTIRQTLTCSAGDSGCGAPGETKTTAFTVTVTPLAPSERTTHIVPGCTEGPSGGATTGTWTPTPAPTTLVVTKPTGGNGTASAGPKPTKVVTAGAGRIGWAGSAVAVFGGGLLMAVLGL